MDSCRGRLNARDPPAGPTDSQYEDVLLQTLPLEYTAIRQAHLERLRTCRYSVSGGGHLRR